MKRTAAAICRLMLLVAALAARLAAQDVTVSPATSVYEDDPPDQMPTLRHALHPDFPDEMLKSPDVGYVTEEVFVDDRGKTLSTEMHSTLPAYEHDLVRLQGTDAGFATRKFSPAMRAGKPVNSLIRFSVVFNPAAAGVAGPDAIPRLLDARPVVDPKRKTAANGPADSQEVIWAMVDVDEQGRPTAVKGAPDRVADLLERSVRTWRFAPGRRAGLPVAQEVRMPFIIVSANTGLAKDMTPPRVVRQFPPTYPYSMRQSRMRGEVLVQFVVDIEGHVKRPFVVRTLNPAFDAPAIEAVSNWVFEPGRANGVPVYAQMQVPIYFALSGVFDGGGDGLNVRIGGDKSSLPEELRVDVEPKIRSIVTPVYPYELLRADVAGSSQVGYIVDEQGHVATSRVVKSDRPEFGLALQAAVERFEYEPAVKNGRPNRALMGFEQDFRSSDHTLVTEGDYRLLGLERKHPERIGNAGDLDSPIKTVVARAPIFPRSLVGHSTRGDALIELLIDEDGHPCLARVVSASDPAFGYSAVQAISLWQFSPPDEQGQGDRGQGPGSVRVQSGGPWRQGWKRPVISWRAALAIPLIALALPAAAGTGPAAAATDLPAEGTALLRTWAPPDYPPEALRENVGGMAMIRMVVDEKGSVASARILDSSDPRLGAAALAAARKWIFTPALDGGRPVACSMDAPVEFSPAAAARKRAPRMMPPPDQTPQPSPRTPAKATATYSGEYPDSLLERRLSGFVRFECTVTAQGHAVAVRVVSATHADFVLPALRSLERWEFTPGMQGDLPIESSVGGDITFDATAANPAEVLAANHITAPDGTPPSAQPEPRVVADPVWPYDLLAAGEGGSATVEYTVDEDGHPRDVQVRSATKPEYGEALVAAVEACVFLRAMDGDHAVSVPLMQRAEFPAVKADGGGDSDPVARLLAAIRAKQIGSSQGLDENLAPVYRVAPEYPGILRKNGRPAGRAEIDFIVDRDGRARLARIASASSEEFGWAAATAVSQWIFRAPLRGGQPVDVRVRVPFEFKSPAH